MPNHYDDKDTLVVTYPEHYSKNKKKYDKCDTYDFKLGPIPEGSYKKMIKQEGSGN